MNENLMRAMKKILGQKRFELLSFFCENCDENGFVFVKISELENKLNQSKPTIISSLKFLAQKGILKRLKNSFYHLNLGENE